VFNGEIYNHADLRPGLEAAGHRYRTRCDTETIVHAYEQWGDACVERFRGMFAFAVWDAPRRRLLLARDRMGIKPLYWAMADGRLIFGSEIKAILESGIVRVEANERAIPELLSTRYLSGAETLFKGVYRLLPGHVLTFERGVANTRQWWDVPVGIPNPAVAAMTETEAVAEFRARLEDAVRTRLMSDVPLGMFLSGGLDSSAAIGPSRRFPSRSDSGRSASSIMRGRSRPPSMPSRTRS
jgi:asparagine synthase (glutamine-hydrolysing)